MTVWVVIGRCSAIPAGYVLLGVADSEEKAEAIKIEKGKVGMLQGTIKWDAIDIWIDIINSSVKK